MVDARKEKLQESSTTMEANITEASTREVTAMDAEADMVSQNKMRRLTAILIMATALASCTRPESYETFVRASEAREGVYSFELDLSDSDCSYDISFYTKIDRPRLRSRQGQASMPLAVIWTSPQGEEFSETVYYPIGQLRTAYRSGVVMNEPGVWGIRVNVISAPRGLRGLGIICRRNEDGTR